jgi:hypothetical protein
VNGALYIHFIKGVMLGIEFVEEEEIKMVVLDLLIVRLILEYE